MVVAHLPNGPPVLHTGDARLTRDATQQQPALQELVGKAVLVLDTTYADPAYCFPPQQEVLQWVLRAVQVCRTAAGLAAVDSSAVEHTKGLLPPVVPCNRC